MGVSLFQLPNLAPAIDLVPLETRAGNSEVQFGDLLVDGRDFNLESCDCLLPGRQQACSFVFCLAAATSSQVLQASLVPLPLPLERCPRPVQPGSDSLVQLDPLRRIASVPEDFEGQFPVPGVWVRREVQRPSRPRQPVKLAGFLSFSDLLVDPAFPVPGVPVACHLDTALPPIYNASTTAQGQSRMIHLIVIRHGRTAWNTADGQHKRFRGQVDLPLAKDGVAQAEATACALASAKLDAIYTSPLQRAVQTAQILAAPRSQAVHILPGLISMDYGDWAGKFDVDVAHQWPELFAQWRHDPFSVRIPGGESMHELLHRVVAAAREALARHSDGETVALVSHQVVTRTLICSLAGLPDSAYWRIRQDLCNLNRFEFDPHTGQFVVAGLNDTCHLGARLSWPSGAGPRIILVRHGQTAWNVGAGEQRFRGRTDLPLDDIGHTQAQAIARRLNAEPISAILTSPLLRTRQTVASLASELGVTPQPHDGLLDIDYGHFQGLTHSGAAVRFPEQARQWWLAPAQVRFPDGEALADVRDRLEALFEELLSRYPGQTVVLAGHQIVNKVAACMLLGLDLNQIWRIRQNTGCINVFQNRDAVWHITRLNDCCHVSLIP